MKEKNIEIMKEIDKYVEDRFKEELIESIKITDLSKYITYTGEKFILEFSINSDVCADEAKRMGKLNYIKNNGPDKNN